MKLLWIKKKYQGNTPVDAPKWSASLWSRYELTQSVALNAGVFYQGERFADSANTSTKDAFTRVDVGATYSTKVAGQDMSFRLNIANLFDADYLEGGGTNNVTIREERTVRIEAKISF